MIDTSKLKQIFQFLISYEENNVPRSNPEVGWKESFIQSPHSFSTQCLQQYRVNKVYIKWEDYNYKDLQSGKGVIV